MRIFPTNCAQDFDEDVITISVKDEEPIGTYYQTKVRLANLPPIIDNKKTPSDFRMGLYKTEIYKLPKMIDPEGCPFTISFEPFQIL